MYSVCMYVYIYIYIHIHTYIYIAQGRFARDNLPSLPSLSHNSLCVINCCRTRTRQKVMHVSRETSDATTKPKLYDLTNILVAISASSLASSFTFAT